MEKLTRITDQIGMWGLILVALALPVSTSLDSILVAVVVTAWVLGGRYRDKTVPHLRNPVVLASLVVITAYLAGSFHGIAEAHEIGSALKDARIFLLIPLFMYFFSLPDAQRRGLNALMIALSANLALSYLIWLDLLPYTKIIKGDIHNATVFKYHITHNILMAFGAYLFATRALEATVWRHRILFAVLSWASMFNVLFMIQGRTGYVVLGALAILMFFQLARWKGLAGVVLLIVVVGGGAWYHKNNPLYGRILQTIDGFNSIDSPTDVAPEVIVRLNFYWYSLQIMRDNPLLGVGTGGFARAYAEQVKGTEHIPTVNPHNEYLMVGVQLGLFGLLCHALLFITQWCHASRLENKSYRMPARGLIVTFLSASLVTSTLMDHVEGLFFAWMTALLFTGVKTRVDWKTRYEQFRNRIIRN